MPWAMARSFQQPAEYTLPGGVSVVQNISFQNISMLPVHVTENACVCVGRFQTEFLNLGDTM